MVNLVGFTQGMSQGRDKLNRRRRDLANAFSEFKAANPTATFDEYQSFIDQYTGDGLGSNYLRGGAPSEEVLKTLAEENEKQRKAQEEQRLVDSLRLDAEKTGMLEAQADKAMLQTDGDDLDAAYDLFVDRLGGQGAVDQFGESTLRNYVSPNRYQNVVNRVVRDRIGDVKTYLEMTNPETIDAADLGEYLGITNKAALSNIVDNAQEINRRRQQEYTEKRRAQIDAALDDAVARGDENPVETVKTRFPNADHEALQSLYENARQRARDQAAQEDLENRRKVGELGNAIYEKISNNEDIRTTIALATPEAAKEQMLAFARRNFSTTPEDFERVYGVAPDQATPDLFSETYERIVNTLNFNQRAQYDKRSQEAQVAAEERIQTFRENNVNRAVTRIEGAYSEDPMASSIVEELAGKYRMDNSTLAAFEEAYQKALQSGNATSADSVIKAIENDEKFSAKATLLDDVIDQMRTALEPLSRRPFASWAQEFKSNISGNYERFQTSISNIRRAEDPARKELAIEQLRSQLLNERQRITTQIKRARDEQASWVEYGTGGFDDAEADRIQRSALERIERIEQQLARIEQQIQAEKEAAAAETPSNPPRKPGDPLFDVPAAMNDLYNTPVPGRQRPEPRGDQNTGFMGEDGFEDSFFGQMFNGSSTQE